MDDTTSTGGTSREDSGGSGGPAVYCPQSDWARDCEAVDCANLKVPCGSLFSPYDDQGLIRTACSGPDGDCGHGFECFDASVFASEWQQPPFGWKPCAGDPDAPPACACAEQCAA